MQVKDTTMGGRPGLVVMGGDSCSEGRGFESWHRILDGHNIFSHIFVVRIVIFVLKRQNKTKKEAEDGPFFQKKTLRCCHSQLVVLKMLKTVTINHLDNCIFIYT